MNNNEDVDLTLTAASLALTHVNVRPNKVTTWATGAGAESEEVK
jgi:hypothetical protein